MALAIHIGGKCYRREILDFRQLVEERFKAAKQAFETGDTIYSKAYLQGAIDTCLGLVNCLPKEDVQSEKIAKAHHKSGKISKKSAKEAISNVIKKRKGRPSKKDTVGDTAVKG